MLAQSFKPADELGITEPQRDALMKTLVLLETGKLKHETGRYRFTSVSEENRKYSGRLAAVPMEALGYASADNDQAHWPIRDELLHNIGEALAKVSQS